MTRAAKGEAPARRTPSGRVHLYVGISLDGYLAALDGGVDWLNPYADARAGFAPFIKTIGAAVMGRATYDFVPTFLGAGLPMFPPAVFAERRVRLVGTRRYPSGVMELRYERSGAARRRP